MALFYAHLTPLDETLARLDQFELTEDERAHLENIILSMFHHRMIEAILLHIPREHHEVVVERIATDPHDLDIMVLIKSHNPEIEDHIMAAGQALGAELQGLLLKPGHTKID